MLAALLGFASLAAAQNLTVSGSVTDPEGYPLEGATILVKGSTTGTSTNAEGRFELSVSKDAVLVASYLGYLSQEKPVSGEHILQVIDRFDRIFIVLSR